MFQIIIWLLLLRLQCNKPHRNSPEPSRTPEPSGTCLRNLHEHTPEPSRTFRKPSGTSGTCLWNFLRNLHQQTPELAGTGTYTSTHWSPTNTLARTGTLRNHPHQHTTFRNLPRNLPAAAQTGTLQNLPEPASEPTPAYQNFPEPSEPLHQRKSELSGTFRNLLPQPTPAHTGTFGEPSGTCPRNLHHTTEPSGTFGNFPPEPAPATRTGTHRSLSGLKTPFAYAIGEKNFIKQQHHDAPSTVPNGPVEYQSDPWAHSSIMKVSAL